MLVMGVDIGSTASKAVIMEDGIKVIAKSVVPVGTGTRGPRAVLEEVLKQAGVGLEQIRRTVATGYGRMTFEEADRQVSEVSCHGRGVHFLVPDARTVVDIGGQDAKAILLDENGMLSNFMMNDKCAAGTGRFLEVMARVLDIRVEDMGTLAEQANHAVSISSTCAVFAESEVISRLAGNERPENILAGIHRSVAKKVVSQVLRIGVVPTVAMSGGVAKNQGVVKALSQELGQPVVVPEDCQLAGAIGAALFAWSDLDPASSAHH